MLVRPWPDRLLSLNKADWFREIASLISMKTKILIVDGHSIIFQWRELSETHSQRGAMARETLIRMLTGLQDSSNWQVVVVFDGKGSRPNEATEPHTIKVFYSKSGQTADSIIERLVAKYGSLHDVTVATDDLLERTTVESFGGMTMSSQQLRDEIDGANRSLSDRLKKLKRK